MSRECGAEPRLPDCQGFQLLLLSARLPHAACVTGRSLRQPLHSVLTSPSCSLPAPGAPCSVLAGQSSLCPGIPTAAGPPSPRLGPRPRGSPRAVVPGVPAQFRPPLREPLVPTHVLQPVRSLPARSRTPAQPHLPHTALLPLPSPTAHTAPCVASAPAQEMTLWSLTVTPLYIAAPGASRSSAFPS